MSPMSEHDFIRRRVAEIRAEQAGPPLTDEEVWKQLKPHVEKAISQERTSCLVQLHWQNLSDPTETIMVGQTEWSDSSPDVHTWARELAERRKSECPEGWCPMVCTEDHESFWWQFGDKIGPTRRVRPSE